MDACLVTSKAWSLNIFLQISLFPPFHFCSMEMKRYSSVKYGSDGLNHDSRKRGNCRIEEVTFLSVSRVLSTSI